jgi:ribonuclease P protein component
VNRRHRLSGRRAFAAVRAQRISSMSGPIRVHVAGNDRGLARAGFSIPKTVGGAVQRNRVRRRLRALLAPRLQALGAVDLVIAVLPAAGGLAAAALADHLEHALGSALGVLSVRVSARARGGGATTLAPRPQPA